MRHDLHMHSTASDGVFSPSEIVEHAKRGSLDVIALTDHDTTAGVPEAISAGESVGIRVIPAAEVSSTRDGREIHILGYGLDLGSEAVQRIDDRARLRRIERMEEMVDRLVAEGWPVTMEDVVRAAGPNHRMIGRPHLARALIERGHASSVENAFDRFIADHRDAFVPTDLGPPEDAIELIVEAGGLPVWAHPPLDLLTELLPGLVDAGLEGLEAVRPKNSGRKTAKIREAARAHGLVVTGGSDWHNPDRNAAIGAFWVTSGRIRDFREALGLPD